MHSTILSTSPNSERMACCSSLVLGCLSALLLLLLLLPLPPQVRVVGVHLVEVEERPFLALVQEAAPGGDLGWQIEDCDFHMGKRGEATLVSGGQGVVFVLFLLEWRKHACQQQRE